MGRDPARYPPIVTARSEQKTFETHTGDDGLYAFRDLPKGRYQSSMGVEAKDGRFEIAKLAPGQYRLLFQPSAPPRRPIYYPGKQFIKEATVIELGDGEHVTGLQFALN